MLGGNFGVWGGLFSTFDCAVKGIRKKEDPYNAIIAGFFTGGSLAIRGGYKAARNGAIGCAVLLAVIEGVGIGFQKLMAGSTKLEVRFIPGRRAKREKKHADAAGRNRYHSRRRAPTRLWRKGRENVGRRRRTGQKIRASPLYSISIRAIWRIMYFTQAYEQRHPGRPVRLRGPRAETDALCTLGWNGASHQAGDGGRGLRPGAWSIRARDLPPGRTDLDRPSPPPVCTTAARA